MNAFSACSLYHEDLRVAMSRPLEQRVKFFLDTTDVEESSELGQLLPNLDLVRQDVARVSAVQETVASMPEQPVIELQEPYTGEDIQIRASHALVLKTQLPRLFLYSFLIMFSDVPKDLVEDVIWALEVFVGLLRECSDEQLDVLCSDELDAVYTYEEPAFEEDTPMETIRSFMRQQSKAKVTILLLRPEVDRPGDAVRYFKAIIDYRRLVVPPEQFFEGERDLLEVYGEALTRSGINDEFAETFLRKYVDSSAASDKTGLRRLIVAKVWLSRVLRRRGSTSAAKSEEKWLLLIPNGTVSPILAQLGGSSWLEGRKDTDKTIRRGIMFCRQCGAHEPMVKLSLCTKCKKFHYCSKECQRKDWPSHKVACRGFAKQIETVERLSLLDPFAGQRLKHFTDWCFNSATNKLPYVSALRLYEDPGRAHTHVIFEQSVYTPRAGPLTKDKFRIIRCAVYRMSDALPEIERALKLSPGEGIRLCNEMLHESHPVAEELVLFLTLRYGEGMSPKLGRDAVNKCDLRYTLYNPKWREAINAKRPLARFLPRDSLRDAEFD